MIGCATFIENWSLTICLFRYMNFGDMKLNELTALLRAHSDSIPRFILPDGEAIPAHFHVTEVGHVAKKFVDCGGTFRDSEACVLQTYVAGDFAHRLTSG